MDRPTMGNPLAQYTRTAIPRASGVPGWITEKRQANLNNITAYRQLKIDSRAPFVLSGFAFTVAELHYPAIGAMPLYVQSIELDCVKEGRDWSREQMVRDLPYLFATPFGLGGLFGSMDLPVKQVCKPNSIIEINLRETGGANRNVSIAAYGFWYSKEPKFSRIGDNMFLESDVPGCLPEPVGRNFVVGDVDLVIAAGGSGDVVFQVPTGESFWADGILMTLDGLPIWAAGLALIPMDVSRIEVQFEGRSEAVSLIEGVPVNMLTVLGSSGVVGARYFDRSMQLQGGSDVIVSFTNTDGNPHTLRGSLVGHRL